jgi:CheY-like chemotaxis protein
VLVIEDDVDIRDSVREVIEQDGYEVLVAADGNEALELLDRAPRPILVLVDLVMPGMDGRKLLRHLESEDRLATLPIVVFTATKELGDTESTHPVLKKPISLEALLKVVRAHCCSAGPEGESSGLAAAEGG